MANGARSVLETFVLLAAVIACEAMLRVGWAQQMSGEATISGFSIPEVDETGRVKWKVLGDSARLNPAGGPVDITKVRMELYKDSQVDMVLTSPRCLFDREKHEAETDAPVEIKGKNLLITGDGFFWSGTNNLLVIRSNAKVIVMNAKIAGTGSTNQTTPTAVSEGSNK